MGKIMNSILNDGFSKNNEISTVVEVSPEDITSEIEEINATLTSNSFDNVDNILAEVITTYNEKYNTNFESKSIKTFLSSLPNMSVTELKTFELTTKDIAYKTALVTKTKAILVNSLLIERALDLIKNQASNMALNEVLIGMIEQIFQWIQFLSDIKEQHEVPNYEAQMKRVVEEENKKRKKNESGTVSESVINRLLVSLKKEYK